MVHAYILIETEVGKAASVANSVRDQGVLEAEDVTGPYDVIVRAEADSVDDLGRWSWRGSRRSGRASRAPSPAPSSTCNVARRGPAWQPSQPPSSRTPRALALGLVPLDREVEQSLDQVRVGSRTPPRASDTSRST